MLRTVYFSCLSYVCLLATASLGHAKTQKPKIADTIRLNVYADNWFKLYINGELIAIDSIPFIPHNVVSVDVLPQYPMTIAVMAKDNAHPETGLEYNNTQIGDGGFILKLGSDIVSNTTWKARSFFYGPLNRDTSAPVVQHTPIPKNWFAIDFDDSDWTQASAHSKPSVRPKSPFYENDFETAEFIWTEDLELDNTVIFRTVIPAPANTKQWPRGHIKPNE